MTQIANKNHFDFRVWRKIFKKVFHHKTATIVMLITNFFLSFLEIIIPMLNADIIKVFFSENPQYDKMGPYIAFYVFIALLNAVVVYLYLKMTGIIEVEVADELRRDAFVNLQHLSFGYFDKTPSGWIMARLTSDARKLSEIISWGLVDIIWGCSTMFMIIVILYIKCWALALIITVIAPIVFSVSVYFRKMILHAYRNVRKINSQITGNYNETILGIKTTKTLVLEEEKNREFSSLALNMKKYSMKAIIRSCLIWPLVLVVSYIGVSITLAAGSGAILGKTSFIDIDSSLLYLFISFSTLFFDPLMQIVRVLADLQQAQAAAERVIGLIELAPEIKDTPDVVSRYGTLLDAKRENWETLIGDVEFKNVDFSYSGKEDVLKNFSLSVKAGMSVGLVGATGSGKTTIVNLLCRFYEPTAGEILIDGKDYRKRSLGWLHENLGYVLQDPHLFNGTIKENVKFGKPCATDEEVISACKSVKADAFIEKFADKYDTVVGEGGAKLSLGERQLISFARAIIGNPKILILDEATSSVDTKTEYDIQSALNSMLKGRTTFVVAHRLSTIINSDLILVIKSGRIIEQGTHKELLKLKGEYYNLYKFQFISEQMEKLS